MLTAEERELCGRRPNTIDYDAIPALHYLGNYVRRLPVNMARMMENAYDWEHLPYVHPSSFADIELVDSGTWGWRAKTGIPRGGGSQVFDLLVDTKRNYWATTIFVGSSAGAQIHTQATSIAEDQIEVDVRFYLPEPAPSDDDCAAVLASLRKTYARLYDEDEDLMVGRQRGLDRAKALRDTKTAPDQVAVGPVDELDRTGPNLVATPLGDVVVRCLDGTWIAHSAVCPHRLGPLDLASVDASGTVQCPWHGYRFDATTGASLQPDCADLSAAPTTEQRGGSLFLTWT